MAKISLVAQGLLNLSDRELERLQRLKKQFADAAATEAILSAILAQEEEYIEAIDTEKLEEIKALKDKNFLALKSTHASIEAFARAALNDGFDLMEDRQEPNTEWDHYIEPLGEGFHVD